MIDWKLSTREKAKGSSLLSSPLPTDFRIKAAQGCQNKPASFFNSSN